MIFPFKALFFSLKMSLSLDVSTVPIYVCTENIMFELYNIFLNVFYLGVQLPDNWEQLNVHKKRKLIQSFVQNEGCKSLSLP